MDVADGGLGKAGIVLFGGVLLLLLSGRPERDKRLRYRWPAAARILVVTGSILALPSCGGNGGSHGTGGSGGPPPTTGPPTTQTGSYSVTVLATSEIAVPARPPVTVQLTGRLMNGSHLL
jgi:hypothetical protein